MRDSVLRLSLPATVQGQYADAQIDDYGDLARSAFPWRPPLRMEVRARASLPAAAAHNPDENSPFLRGTAGFGFWNYPFSVRGDILMLPEAIWFFYASPPSHMALVPDSPGWGWKAQVVHSMRLGAAFAVLPTALTIGWSRLTGNTRHGATWLQRLSGTHETLLTASFTEWHDYMLEWHTTQAMFWVDGTQVFTVPRPPVRPLGFVAWLDNQYAVVTPRGTLRFGATNTAPEWLELDFIRITLL